MRGILRFAVCLGGLILGATVVLAEDKQDADKTAVLRAIHRFRLSNADTAWHMKASVQLLQEGKPGETGSVEVLHDAHDNRRTVTLFPGFSRISTVNAKGRFLEGNMGDAPAAVGELLRFLEQPVKTSTLRKAKLVSGYRTVAGQKFHCVHAASDRPEQTFCNTEGSPAIRYMTLPQSVYSVLIEQVGSFQGGDVPVAAVILFADMPIAHFDLTFSELSAEEAAAIRPAKEAVLESPSANVARAVTEMVSHAAFGTPARSPLLGASTLLRLELDSSGKLKSSEGVSTSHGPLARRVLDRLSGRQIVPPSSVRGDRFINYSIVIPPRDMESHDDPFYPRAGTNSVYP